MSSDNATRKTRPAVICLIVLLIAVCAVGIYALMFVASGKNVLAAAENMQVAAQDIQTMVDEGSLDLDRLRSDAQDLADNACAMHEETSGTVWQIATYIPVYGGDAQTVRLLAEVLDDLGQDALSPLIGALPEEDIASLGILDLATVGIETLAELNDVLPGVSSTVQEAAATVDGIGDQHLDELDQAVDLLRTYLDDAAKACVQYDNFANNILSYLGLSA